MRLRIIPVLDILDGVAVHAVRGRRKEYKPLKSVICVSADPLDVAQAFHSMGFRELYVADLNAIMGNGKNLAVIERMAKKTRLRLMVDAGVADITGARAVLQHAAKVVVGTETLTDIGFVGQAVRLLGPDRVVVSFDMKNGQLLSKLNFEGSPSPIEVIREFQNLGLTQIIVLDLAKVGSEEGVDLAFVRMVLENVNLQVLVGGGVRNMDDLVTLNGLGVFGVLVATALHSGEITVEKIQRAGLTL
jgi:phosphoribosylformimino-5-aminoimidazole carboxamide ribotide isomerase